MEIRGLVKRDTILTLNLLRTEYLGESSREANVLGVIMNDVIFYQTSLLCGLGDQFVHMGQVL